MLYLQLNLLNYPNNQLCQKPRQRPPHRPSSACVYQIQSDKDNY
nr:MAG TPA: hypothetical protein [Crassvirales sp.]